MRAQVNGTDLNHSFTVTSHNYKLLSVTGWSVLWIMNIWEEEKQVTRKQVDSSDAWIGIWKNSD